MFVKDFLKKLFQNRILTAVLLLCASISLGIMSLYFACETTGIEVFNSYFEKSIIAILNILPCIWLVFILWFITKRAAVAFTLSSLVVMGFTIASWFKLQFRNDPMMFGDLFLIKEASNMSERYTLFMTESMRNALIILVLIVAILAVIARGKPTGIPRISGIIVCLSLLIPMKIVYFDETIYTKKTANIEYINQWAATEVYISKGFVYPFIYSIQDAIKQPPENYNEKETKALIESYTKEDIPDEEKVDIIGIMLEAYSDLSVYDQIEFEVDPYEYYHELEQESIAGNLYTNIFAGGTVDSERAFLTGFSEQGSFRGRTNSYTWYFKDQGYTVTGNHPSYDWFYNRANINQNLGFETYNFFENHYAELANDEIAMDRIFMPEIVNLHEQHKAESDKPYFAFNVTYQGHGPYGTDANYYGTSYVKPETYSKESENILNNYFGTIADTNENLKNLVDHYKQSQDPVILVLFGDHKPWLGDSNSVYNELGINLNNTESEGFKNYYSTRYLIWANDAAKEVLGNDFVGQGPDIGPYFLMNLLFRECGWKGPEYMQAIDEASQKVPVINKNGLYMLADGTVTEDLPEEYAALTYDYACLSFCEQNNFRYKYLLE